MLKMKDNYAKLFEPFTFKSGAKIENRFLMAPMTTASSFENGMITTDELMYYKRRSGGVGAVITACAHVREDGKFKSSPSISDDKFIPSLAKLAKEIKETGSKAILQIFHVGRMEPSSGLRGLQPVSASAIPAERPNAEVPRALESSEVEDIIKQFGEATRRAIKAGFDGVEIHGANTYLIQQFFSPHSNQRDDYWGGTLEKRMNFPIEIVRSVTDAVKKNADRPFITGYRLSPEELEEPGITLQDTLSLLKELKVYPLDYFHISLGNIFQSSLRNNENEDPVLKTIQDEVGDDIPIIGVGNIITPDDAVAAMDELGIPLIALGRELIIEPDWVEKMSSGNIETIRKVIEENNYEDLAIPDAMWEYVKERPGWLPIV